MMQSEQLIIGSKYKSKLEGTLGNNVIWIPNNPYVDERLSGHVDLSVIEFNNKLYALDYLKSYINIDNCEFINENIDKKYPNDAKMNACIIGNSVFCNKSTISEYILEKLIEGEYNIINVNQGYSRCCIYPVTENAIITSDKGITKIAKDNNFDVLEIEPGFINLDGFDYGFIGGTGFVDDSIAYFSGSLDGHPNKEDIFAFCRNYNINIDYLTRDIVFDIGGIYKVKF